MYLNEKKKLHTSRVITQMSMLVSAIFHHRGANTEICGSKRDGGRAYSPDPWAELVSIVLKSQLEIVLYKGFSIGDLQAIKFYER